jgi:hypothetical protein
MSPIGRRRGGGRPLPPLVCRWDLDKTYLRSEFETIRQLLRTAFERGEDKVDVPGVVELIKVVCEAAARRQRRCRTLFVSASPPQIGKAIRAKLDLDGVPYDGIVFKNQLQHLRPGKFRNLREHVGFKLVTLLRGRLEEPPEARELLFGDDWESDSLSYSLYADIVAGRLVGGRLDGILRRVPVDPEIVREVLGLAARAGGADAVDRIFINLERRTPPAVFRLFGDRVVPTFNYFQTACVLAGAGYLESEDVVRVGRALTNAAVYTPRRLENSLGDLVRRGFVSLRDAERLLRPLHRAGVLPAPHRALGWRRVLAAVERLRVRRRRLGMPPSPGVTAVDYDAILDRLHATTPAEASGGPA